MILRLKPAKTEEISPEAQMGLLGSLLNIGKRGFKDRMLWRSPQWLSLEIYSIEQKTRFYLLSPSEYLGYFNSQVLSHYPKTMVNDEEDPLPQVFLTGSYVVGAMKLSHAYVYPIKTFKLHQEHPPLASILGFLAKLKEGEAAVIQLMLRVPSQGSLQKSIRKSMVVTDVEGNEESSPYKSLMDQKLTAPLLEGQLRLSFASLDSLSIEARIKELAGAYGIYTQAEGNSLVYSKLSRGKQAKLTEKMISREFYMWKPKMILNTEEVASLWHLPDKSLEQIKGIDWGKTLLAEAPDNLPVAEEYTTDEAKREVNFFAKTEWRNHEAVFGIKQEDRRKHVYIIGKTGAGKTTLIANMAINDIRNGQGVAVIDPHGDLSEMILDYIPKRRLNDVIYLDPTLSDDRSFSLNLFDDDGAAHTDVVASGIISVFYKLYHHSWGPRLEYILRNTILSLLYYEKATFMDIITILTNKNYRNKVVADIQDKDPVLTAFWREEFDKMNERLRVEAISPILNKVGQFLSSQRIRHIVGTRKSTFSFEKVMNDGKILILNLSQGKLGEDTTALLGAMFITKMQLTAMRRVHLPEEERSDFHLYVDEFQNFATHSFIKILSEARKYRLDLVLANQYIGQVDEEIQKAIFGNVGSLLSFVVGARDANMLVKEFGGVFTEDEMVALGKYEILLKMSIDGLTGEPFVAKTLPLPSVINQNKDKIIRVALERYYIKQV